jgi:hypothetical protein
MMRDVLVASIHRGQFPPALLGLIVLALILKMPAADVTAVLFQLLTLPGRHGGLSFTLALLLATGWFFHARLQRRWIGDERRRLDRDRAELKAVVSALRNRASEVHS